MTKATLRRAALTASLLGLGLTAGCGGDPGGQDELALGIDFDLARSSAVPPEQIARFEVGAIRDLPNNDCSPFRSRPIVDASLTCPQVATGSQLLELRDDEGHATQRNTLIEDGVLTDYMWDFLRSRKQGRTPSGNGRRQSYMHLPMVRMTNTYVLDGDSDPDEIVRSTERGVYVARLGGGSVNTASGDFVFGMTEAYLIENGEITEPLREANLIGNGPQALRDIDAVGNDFAMGGPGTCGKDGQGVPVGTGQPTLRVAAMTVGGTAA